MRRVIPLTLCMLAAALTALALFVQAAWLPVILASNFNMVAMILS